MEGLEALIALVSVEKRTICFFKTVSSAQPPSSVPIQSTFPIQKDFFHAQTSALALPSIITPGLNAVSPPQNVIKMQIDNPTPFPPSYRRRCFVHAFTNSDFSLIPNPTRLTLPNLASASATLSSTFRSGSVNASPSSELSSVSVLLAVSSCNVSIKPVAYALMGTLGAAAAPPWEVL